MNLKNFHGLGSRALFVAMHAALPMLVYIGLFLPYQSWVSEQHRVLSDKQSALARFEAVVAQEAAVRKFLQQVKERNAGGELLEGQNESAASAALQSRLKTAAETHGVSVRSVRATPNRVTNTSTLLGARIEISGPITAVRDFIYAIESSEVLLVVTSAMFRSQPAVQSPQVKIEPPVDAQFEVYGGYIQRDKS
jgi:general secretion pathway protein M